MWSPVSISITSSQASAHAIIRLFQNYLSAFFKHSTMSTITRIMDRGLTPSRESAGVDPKPVAGPMLSIDADACMDLEVVAFKNPNYRATLEKVRYI